MPSNHATLADEAGSFPDWLELCNTGKEEACLVGCSLRCGGDTWPLPPVTLEAGEYLVIFCDGKNEGLHSSFSISADGEELKLLDPERNLLDGFPATPAEEDRSLGRDETGAVVPLPFATPGYANTEEGYATLQHARTLQQDELLIHEVSSTEDWVELLNPTDRTLCLADYALSDKEKDRLLCPLPDREIAPGELVLLTEVPALNAAKDELYLTRRDGLLCDYCLLRDLPIGCSYGRDEAKGFCYFETSTPGCTNAPGVRFLGETPVLLGSDGLFDGSEEVLCVLSGPGDIRYTVDGSEPTPSSWPYIGPMLVPSTCVIRAASFQEDHLRSEVLSLTYLVGEEHTLPVVSLVCEDFERVYNHPETELELPADVMLYDGEKRVQAGCGVKLHGATSRFAQEKKSLKLNFRNRYGGELSYDLFGNGISSYASVLLRSGQEGHGSSYMRDALMHDCALALFPDLPAQDHRYAALYINGRYWGLYNLREAHSEEQFAARYGVSAVQWREKWPTDSVAEEVFQFAMSHDLSDPAAYEEVAAHICLESVIAWLILQDYSGNFDFNSPNMRFYWAEEKLWYALVDLDLGLYQYGSLPALTDRGYYAYNRLAGALLKNVDFREALCRAFNAALCGELSDEKMLERIDCFADEIRPEITREKARWGGKPADWEAMVQELRDRITYGKGYAATVVKNLVTTKAIPSTEAKVYFPTFN